MKKYGVLGITTYTVVYKLFIFRYTGMYGLIYLLFYSQIIDIQSTIDYLSSFQFLDGSKTLQIISNNPTVLLFIIIRHLH